MRCSRCGHGLDGDPSATVDGNHLVVVEGDQVLQLTEWAQDRGEVTLRAGWHLRFVWCAEIAPPGTPQAAP